MKGDYQDPVIASAESLQLAWLASLATAHTSDEAAAVIADLTQAELSCRSAGVVWDIEGSRHLVGISPAQLEPDDDVWFKQASASTVPVLHPRQPCRVAMRLCQQPETALLLLQFTFEREARDFPGALALALQLAGAHLQRTLEWTAMQRAHQQVERSEALQHALFAISDLAGSDLHMPEMLRGIHAIVSSLMYAENFFIVLRQSGLDTIRFLYFEDIEDPSVPGDGHDISLDAIYQSPTWYVLTDGKPLMGDSEALIRQASGPMISMGVDSHDWLGVPMLRDREVGGALVVQSYQTNIGYSSEDRTLLEFVGSHILTALERKQTKADLEQRVRSRTLQLAEANRGLELEILERQRAEHLQKALFQIAQLATEDVDEQECYRRIHEVVGGLINAENFFIALLSDDRSQLTFPYAVDKFERPPAARERGRGLSDYVLRLGQALCVNNEQAEALAERGEFDARIGPPSHCWLGVPLFVADEVIGLVAVQSYTASVVYGLADEELLGFVATQIANSLARRRAAAALRLAYEQLEQRVDERTGELRKEIVERERAQDQLKHQVMHDSLTGLANRDRLRECIDRALTRPQREPDSRCALLYLDVDRFKVINDSLGHLAGDVVLKEVATRLASCVRHPDLVARLSGDEFAILLESVDSIETATSVAQRVMDALGAPLLVDGKELRPSASMGVALGHARHSSAEDVLRDADIALYRAKQLGRKRFELFDETLAKNVIDVLALEGELREALQRRQFEPYFQPICRLEDGEIMGFEALIRWNHPQRALLGPADFLKVAEDSGLIEAIDWHLFELGCRALVAHAPHADLFLTLNVSALHLRHADFDQKLFELLRRTGLSPARMVAEVTEGSLLDDPGRVRGTLERLRLAGVGAALDDFGTGYSSLSYLHSLPLRMLKIDQSFVRELDKPRNTNSSTVVAAILALARALDIQVIAEGIETPAQREALVAMGCELGQGYLLGRPAPASDWEAEA